MTKEATRFYGEDGTLVTDEMLEAMAKPWDEGKVPGKGGKLRRGRPRLNDEPTQVLSFKVPCSLAEAIAKAATQSGESRSRFLREAAEQKVAAVLGS